jgi:hypothetical protein
MPPVIKRTDLSEPEQQLVELIHDLNFGRIEHLQLRDGKPILRPLPRVIAAVKIKGDDHQTDSELRTDFYLKQSLIDLLALIHRVGEGELLLIDVRHGLPFSVEIEWLAGR